MYQRKGNRKMRKLVNVRKEFRLNGGEWLDTSIWHHLKYKEESECVTKQSDVITSWQEFVDYINDNYVPNASVGHTLFRNIPYILLPKNNDFNYPWIEVREKDFVSFELRVVYNDHSTNLKTLAELLDADEFCQYLKDRGINHCPMMK
jgi:hypothetical protein